MVYFITNIYYMYLFIFKPFELCLLLFSVAILKLLMPFSGKETSKENQRLTNSAHLFMFDLSTC